MSRPRSRSPGRPASMPCDERAADAEVDGEAGAPVAVGDDGAERVGQDGATRTAERRWRSGARATASSRPRARATTATSSTKSSRVECRPPPTAATATSSPRSGRGAVAAQRGWAGGAAGGRARGRRGRASACAPGADATTSTTNAAEAVDAQHGGGGWSLVRHARSTVTLCRLAAARSLTVSRSDPGGDPVEGMDELPEWEDGTVAILSTIGGEPHAIPVSTAVRAGPRRLLLALALRRRSLALLRAEPRVALTILAGGDVAVTAHWSCRRRRQEPMRASDGVAAVALDVDELPGSRPADVRHRRRRALALGRCRRGARGCGRARRAARAGGELGSPRASTTELHDARALADADGRLGGRVEGDTGHHRGAPVGQRHLGPERVARRRPRGTPRRRRGRRRSPNRRRSPTTRRPATSPAGAGRSAVIAS